MMGQISGHSQFQVVKRTNTLWFYPTEPIVFSTILLKSTFHFSDKSLSDA